MTDVPGRRPRVLLVSLGRLGGVTQYGWLMGRALAKQCDLAAVYSAAAENAGKWPTLGIPHLGIPTFSSVASMLASMLAVGRFARIARFARDFDPDLIYYPGGHAWKPVLDLVLPRRARVVVTIHDPHLHPGEDSLAHRAFDAINRLRAQGYVLLNHNQRGAFIERFELDPTTVSVLPLGALDDIACEAQNLSDVEYLADLESIAGNYLLFVGRLKPYKGIDTLLEAYRDSVAESGVPLVLAGSGSFSEKEHRLLESLSRCEVRVINRWLEIEDISALIASAKFVVIPYSTATQSGVIPLAAALGVPTIASDAGGLSEQVVDGTTGMLFRAGDSAALAVSLSEALGMDEIARQRMSRNASAHAEANWSWDRIAEQLLGFCASLLDR